MPIVSGNVRLSAASSCSLGTDKEKLPAPILHRLMTPAEGALPGAPYSKAQCWGGDVGKCALFWPDTVPAPHEAVRDEQCAWLAPLAKSQVAFTRFFQQCYEAGYWYAKYSVSASWAIGRADARPAVSMTAMLPDFAAAFLLGARSASQTASCRGPLAQDAATFAAVVARDVAALPAEQQLRLRAQAAYLATMLHRYLPGAEPTCEKFMAVLRAGVRVGWRLPAAEGFPAPHEIDAAADHLVKGLVSAKMYAHLTHAALSEALRTFHHNFLEAAGLAGSVPAIALDTAWPRLRDAGAARVGRCAATADRSQLESYLLVQHFIVRYGHRHGPFLGQPQLLDRWNGYVDHVACAAATTGCYGERPYGASKAEAGSNAARLLAKAAAGAAPQPLPWFAARPYLYAPTAPARLAALDKEAAAAALADDFARCYRSAALGGGGGSGSAGGAVTAVGAVARAGRHWGKGQPADVILTPPASAGGAVAVRLLRRGDKEKLLSAPASGTPYRSDSGSAAFKLAAQAVPCDAFKAANSPLGGKVGDGCGAVPLPAGALCLCIAVVGESGRGLDVLRVRVEAETESHVHVERGVAALFAGGGGAAVAVSAPVPAPAPQQQPLLLPQQQPSLQAGLAPAQPLASEPQSQLPAAQQAQAAQQQQPASQQTQAAQQQQLPASQQTQAAQQQQPLPLTAPQPQRSGGHLLRTNAIDHA